MSLPVCKLTLDELLCDARRYPLSLNEFRHYMREQYADELLDFLIEVRTFEAEVHELMEKEEKEKDRSTQKGIATVASNDRLVTINAEKDRLLERYLMAGSECEINVSSNLRASIEHLFLSTSSCTVSRSPTASNMQTPAASITSTPTLRPAPTVRCLMPSSVLLTLFDPAVQEVVELIGTGTIRRALLPATVAQHRPTRHTPPPLHWSHQPHRRSRPLP